MQEEKVALIADAIPKSLENLDGISFRSTLSGLYCVTIDELKVFGTVYFAKLFRQLRFPVS